MFGSYQFKPPLPQQRRGSWIESYLGDLQSLDGAGRDGLFFSPDGALGLGPVQCGAPQRPGCYMDFIKGKAETLTPGSPKLREDMALTLSKGLRPTWEMNKEHKHVFPLPSEAL